MDSCAKSRHAVAGVAVFFVLCLAAAALADPCLSVYPDAPCIYHYDATVYYTVGPGDMYYDPVYDRGGEVLLYIATNTVDLSIYQAPNLAGFQESTPGEEGYFCNVTSFNLIVDGFNDVPITYHNILLVIEAMPSSCAPVVTVDGNPILSHPTLGLYYPAGDLVVSTPTTEGNNYSDVLTFAVDWQVCEGIRIWAFADENFDFGREAGECFSAFSHDVTIPVEESTWGAVKALYEDGE